MITIQDVGSGGASELRAALDALLGAVRDAEPFYLVVFDSVDHLDNVKIRRVRLDFTRNGAGRATARTSVYSHPYAGPQLQLPIVAGGDDKDPATWHLVGNAQIALGAHTSNSAATTLIVERERDDAARVIEPSDAAPPADTPWVDLWRRLPRTVDRTRSNALDLVIAIELSGPAAVVTPRLTWARQLLEAVAAGPSSGHRYGLIGYRDHQFRFDGRSEQIVEVAPPDGIGHALEQLSQWEEGVARGEDGLRQDLYAAPIEEMLQAANRIAWRDRTHRVLLTLGARPAHPERKTADLAMRCPNTIDWRSEAARLKQHPLQRFFAVRDAPPWLRSRADPPPEPSLHERYVAVWGALGYTGALQPKPSDRDGGVSRMAEAVLGLLQEPNAIPLAKATR